MMIIRTDEGTRIKLRDGHVWPLNSQNPPFDPVNKFEAWGYKWNPAGMGKWSTRNHVHRFKSYTVEKPALMEKAK